MEIEVGYEKLADGKISANFEIVNEGDYYTKYIFERIEHPISPDDYHGSGFPETDNWRLPAFVDEGKYLCTYTVVDYDVDSVVRKAEKIIENIQKRLVEWRKVTIPKKAYFII